MSNKPKINLLSLFSGIGAFELSISQYFDFNKVYQSEIDANAVSILQKYFPMAIQLGDVTKINGAKIDPCEFIVGGWPCQSNSIAGKRTGMDDMTKSGLIVEFLRICREMLDATNNQYPRWICAEQVVGWLSVNKGKDFDWAMTQFAELGAGFDIDIDIKCASDFGVPQRRKRIFIVAENKLYRQKVKSKYRLVDKLPDENEQIPLIDDDLIPVTRHPQIVKALQRWGGETITGYVTAPHTPIESKLSDVLEQDVDPKYNLSERACRGIMTRAERRGKKLPVLLELALRIQCGETNFILEIPEKDKSLEKLFNQIPIDGIDYLSAWDGQGTRVFTDNGVAPTLSALGGGIGAKQGGVVLQCAGFNGHKSVTGSIQYQDEVAPTLEMNMPSNALYLAGFMGGQGAKAGSIAYQEEVSPTIKATNSGTNTVPDALIVQSIQQNASGEVRMSDMAYTLSTNSNASGRNAPLVFAFAVNQRDEVRDMGDATGALQAQPGMKQTTFVAIMKTDQTGSNGLGISESEIAYTLDTATNQTVCAIGIGEELNAQIEGIETLLSHQSGGSRQYVACFTASQYAQYKEDVGTLRANGGDNGGGSENLIVAVEYILPVVSFVIRRLTPVECEKLQYFPIGWTQYGHDGKVMSDTARYRVLGNSIAGCCLDFIFKNIVEVYQNDRQPENRNSPKNSF